MFIQMSVEYYLLDYKSLKFMLNNKQLFHSIFITLPFLFI